MFSTDLIFRQLEMLGWIQATMQQNMYYFHLKSIKNCYVLIQIILLRTYLECKNASKLLDKIAGYSGRVKGQQPIKV